MSTKMVNLQLINKHAQVLFDFEMSDRTTSFDLVLQDESVYDKWLEIWQNYVCIWKLPPNLYKTLHRVVGLDKLPCLKTIYIDARLVRERRINLGLFPQHDSDWTPDLAPIEQWPGIDSFFENKGEYISLPTHITPKKLQPMAHMYSAERCSVVGECSLTKKMREWLASKSYAKKRIYNSVLLLAPVQLPLYIMLWIVDWLPGVAKIPEYKKVEWLTQMQKSIEKIYERKV